MNRQRVLSVLLFVFSLLVPVSTFASSEGEMAAAVHRLAQAAEKRTTLWPWEGPLPEVANVASYGEAIAPLLVTLLAEDPDSFDENAPDVDWSVQQQVALALCKIYGVSEEAGHVYMNRASRETNASVKRFWKQKVGSQ